MIEANSGNGQVFESPVQQRISFEEKYEDGKIQERTRLTEDGKETVYSAYAVDLMPGNANSLRRLTQFVLESLQAGYTEATDRLITPTFIEPRDQSKHATVLFFFEKSTPSGSNPVPANPGEQGGRTQDREDSSGQYDVFL